MVLRALYDLHSRLVRDPAYGMAPPGRSVQKITFVVVLEPDGHFVTIEDARIPGNRRPEPRRVMVLGVTKSTGSGLNPCFLWDAPGYLLGWDPRPGKADRALVTFPAFRDRHLQVKHSIGVPEYSAVCRFLEEWEPAMIEDFPFLEEAATGFGTFKIRGKTAFVHDHPAIQEWWDRRTEGDPERMRSWWEEPVSKSSETAQTGQCLVTGTEAPIARVHDKIKGVTGAKSSGASLVGFNEPAYWSYHFEQSYNAPVSIEAARRYVAGLNALLDGPMRAKHRIDVGKTTMAFWTDRPSPTEDVFAPFLAEGSAALEQVQDEAVRARIQAFLRALREGREAYADLGEDPESTSFFLLGLAAPTPARIAARFFRRGTVAELLEQLRRHHRDVGIERRFAEGSRHPEPELPSLQFLLDETRPPKGDVPPLLPAALLESIVTGTRYPEALYAAILRRITADRIVNYPRACVIKGYLVRNLGKEIPVSLDRSRIDSAYRLGRLFAALEKTQIDALGHEIKATIRERFYSAASATPGAVFPRLLRTYQHHLAKLGGGAKVNREKLIQEILDPLEGFPTHLGLTDQGLFALGYYHQTNDFYRSKDERNTSNQA